MSTFLDSCKFQTTANLHVTILPTLANFSPTPGNWKFQLPFKPLRISSSHKCQTPTNLQFSFPFQEDREFQALIWLQFSFPFQEDQKFQLFSNYFNVQAFTDFKHWPFSSSYKIPAFTVFKFLQISNIYNFQALSNHYRIPNSHKSTITVKPLMQPPLVEPHPF